MYEHIAEVRGRGQFPIDMLRYDQCYPRTGDDAHKIASARDDRAVVIVTKSDDPIACWTERRWASYLWRLTPITGMAP